MFSRVFHKSKRGSKGHRNKISHNESIEEQLDARAVAFEAAESEGHESSATDSAIGRNLSQGHENYKTEETEPGIPPPLPRKKHSITLQHSAATITSEAKQAVNDSQIFFPSNLATRSNEAIFNIKETDDEDVVSTASETLFFRGFEGESKQRSLSLSVFPRAKCSPYKQTRRIFINRKKTDGADFDVKYVRVHGPSDGAYKNQSEPRGYIFIKNFELFDGGRFERRSGSAKDYSNLLHLFQGIGYKKCKKCCESGHITKDKLMQDINAFRNLDHKLYDSAIIIIMSHGVKDKTFVTSDNEEVDLLDVYSSFNNGNCEGLKNKPKIFILQFCRPKSTIPARFSSTSLFQLSPEDTIDLRIREQVGLMKVELRQEMQAFVESSIAEALKNMNVNYVQPNVHETSPSLPYTTDEQVEMAADRVASPQASLHVRMPQFLVPAPRSPWVETDARKLPPTPNLNSSPDYSDMYSIFSTNSGGVAYRDPKKGSLLIQAICRVFSSHAYQDDIEELVRKVSNTMQQELSKDDPLSSHRHAVVERVNNGLDKAFYFNPFEIKDRKRYITVG